MSRHTLLLQCAAPMQSWGTRSRFTERDTEREPTKSGVIGLIAAAMGRPRDAPIDDLAQLRMGVRIDREGIVRRDFQTAVKVRKADPKKKPQTVLSNRYYLSDAAFLVGLESDESELLRKIFIALQSPCWPLFLGRKAFVPGLPVYLPDGLLEGVVLEDALAQHPPIAEPHRDDGATARTVMEVGFDQEGDVRLDVPLSFVSEDRRYAPRKVLVGYIPRSFTSPSEEVESCT